MEEGNMKTSDGTLRTTGYLALVLLISAGLAACGGSGGSSTSPGTSGPAVRVSIASATSFPDGTTSAPSTDALSPAITAPPEDSPDFEHLLVTVTKLALIPSTGEVTDSIDPPIQIDLLNLSGDNVATLLNQFSGVPAGEYSKIRVYYDNVVGQTANDNILFHPTANSHFDVNFRGKNLVIPVTSDPGGGIEFYSVLINVVGLKHVEAGNSGNFLLRPQVFATVVDGPLEYKVTGVADNVMIDRTFDILTLGGRSIPAAFSVDLLTGTTWAYSDNVLYGSLMVIGRDASVAVPAFKDRAEVSAIGVFDTNLRLQASHITFTFPDFRIGKVFSTWSADNTYFSLNLPLDNLVYALPDKTNPLYTDFRVPPIELLNGYNLIVPNPDNTVKARGYDFTGSQGAGLQAFWISIDNNIVP
jgi:hypothetical protein